MKGQAATYVLLTLIFLGPLEARATETAESLSSQSLLACQEGRVAPDRETRLVYFQRAEALASRALEVREQHANAHFALFCSLGEQLRLDGENLSSLFGLRRVLAELDRTLELDPSHVDALSAKGTLLMRLPSLLGGDEERGEQMLWQVIKRDSKAINARLVLARTYCARGHHHEALKLARTALYIANATQRQDLIPEARATISELGASDGRIQEEAP